MPYLLLLLSYLAGATPTSYWVGRAFHGIDLREHGSGNLGATNSFRVLGAASAAPVMVVDIAKGFAPVFFFPALAGLGFGWALAFGAAAIVGHVFSIWMGFKGGKGIATSCGVFLAFAPWAVLGAFLLWVALVFSTGYVSLGSIGAAIALPILLLFTPHEGGTGLMAFTLVLATFVIWAHRANIGRLVRGEENRFRRAPVGATQDGADASGVDASETEPVA